MLVVSFVMFWQRGRIKIRTILLAHNQSKARSVSVSKHDHFFQERVFLLKAVILLTTVASVMVLYGWRFEPKFLVWLFPSAISMKANTAAGFILANIALYLFLLKNPLYRTIQRFIAGFLFLLGSITLYEYVADIELPNFDGLFIRPEMYQNISKPISIFTTRMSALSTVNWMLISVSIFLLTHRNYRILNLARMLLLPIIFSSIMILIGYAYGVRELYYLGFYNPLSPVSAILFILLCVSLLFMHSERGFMRLFVGRTLGSRMARGLLPTLIIVFITIGWLGRQGSSMGWYNNQIESSMLVFFTLFLSSILIIWQARAQHGQELLRQRAQHALELSNLKLEKKVAMRTKELQQLTLELEAISLTDSLTGLPNRRAFNQRMSIEWQRTLRYATPLAIMMLDVDHFKRFNDDFGHQTGDDVLIQVGKLLAHAVRTTDFASRYGGEEFIVILPNSTLDEAMPIAQRICDEIAQYAWPQRQVTISIGVATYHGQEEIQDLIAQADMALYQAKAAGRNRVVSAEPSS